MAFVAEKCPYLPGRTATIEASTEVTVQPEVGWAVDPDAAWLAVGSQCR